MIFAKEIGIVPVVFANIVVENNINNIKRFILFWLGYGLEKRSKTTTQYSIGRARAHIVSTHILR